MCIVHDRVLISVSLYTGNVFCFQCDKDPNDKLREIVDFCKEQLNEWVSLEELFTDLKLMMEQANIEDKGFGHLLNKVLEEP